MQMKEGTRRITIVGVAFLDHADLNARDLRDRRTLFEVFDEEARMFDMQGARTNLWRSPGGQGTEVLICKYFSFPRCSFVHVTTIPISLPKGGITLVRHERPRQSFKLRRPAGSFPKE
jgi:hypothetical protein